VNFRPRYPAFFLSISSAAVGLLLAVTAFAANPVPQVVGPPIPQAVVPGSGAFTLKVYGANFVSGAVVNWNRSPRSTTFISARELQAQILASDVEKPTAGYITVTDPPPGGGVSSSSYALVEVHKPTKTINPGQYQQYFSGSVPWYAVAADFTNDGKLDLVTGFNVVDFSKGNGDGTFQSGHVVASNYYTQAGIAFGDFNGDGNLDLLYGLGDSRIGPPTYIRVLLGEGNGKFHGLPRFGPVSNSYIYGIVVGDFNGDGKLDFAASYEGGPAGGGVFLGNGDGTFKQVQHLYKGADMVGGDFNGDGKLDLVVEYGTGFYLLLGNGDGTFQKPRRFAIDTNYAGCGAGPFVVVNDFNGDGNADLGFCDNRAPGPRIGILLGNGDGTFKKPVYYETGLASATGFSFAVGDFSSDGNTDFLVSQPGIPAENAILLGNGDGTFQRARKLQVSAAAGPGIIIGDFNSDGLLDFAFLGDGVVVYIQK
jgi:FG-GAP-like repeat